MINFNTNFVMQLEKLSKEVLHLPESQRAELARKILLSLDKPSKNEIVDFWFQEAKNRAEELNSGSVIAVPSDIVRNKAALLLK